MVVSPFTVVTDTVDNSLVGPMDETVVEVEDVDNCAVVPMKLFTVVCSVELVDVEISVTVENGRAVLIEASVELDTLFMVVVSTSVTKTVLV